jgi:hypothetical protein
MLHIVARQRVRPGGTVRWVAGLVAHRGDPFVMDCGHRHDTKQDALDCANAGFRHCDPGSLAAEVIERHGGLEPAKLRAA